jgi:hypothetical protein
MSDSSHAGDALEPSDEVYLVYGSVMHTVQYWELALALRSWRMHTPPVEQREAESQSAAKAVDRIEKASTRATASQARKELEGELPEELLETVSELIAVRNRLAHRFLRDRLGDYDGAVRPHWPAVADAVVERLFAGEPVGFAQVIDRASNGEHPERMTE